MSPPKLRVLVVDDHPLVREGVANLIHQQPDMSVCAEAASAPEALQSIGLTSPNVILTDLALENGSGLDLIKDVKSMHPATAILVLSMHDEMLYAERVLRAGARGYLMKREAAKKVIQGIRAVSAGELFVSERITALIAAKLFRGSPAMASPVDQLSDRELEVFELLGHGQSTRQIADRLHVGFKTVQAYSARIKSKLNLANATELLRAAMRWTENGSKMGGVL